MITLTNHKTYTTPLSRDEALAVVQEMISSTSKFLFITIRHYFGEVKGSGFLFTTYSGLPTALMVPQIKGQVTDQQPTYIKLKLQLPIIPAIFLLIVPVLFVPGLLTMEEMTINGVVREPTIVLPLYFWFSRFLPFFIFSILCCL